MGQPGAVDHFSASRYQYLPHPQGDGKFCVGNAAECDFLTGHGAVRIPWRRSPRPEDVEKVRDLFVEPSDTQRATAVLPAFLPALVNLESLSLPMPLVGSLSGGRVGEGLRTLTFESEYEDPVPAVPLDGAAALPGLQAVMMVSHPVTLPRVIDPLPPLKYLRTFGNGDKAVLRQLRGLPTLRHLELVRLKSMDVFDSIVAPLHALEITATGPAFPVAGLSALATLRALRLNTVRAEIDCAVFTALPEIVEITVLNCFKLRNVEALLDCPKLESIEFCNCGKPFTRETRAQFRAREFARLAIDHC